MPPFVSTKRDRSESLAQNSPPTKKKAIAKPKPTKKQEKKTLFDAADELGKKQGSSEKARKFLEGLNDDDDESSLSEADSDEFEDVPAVKRRKTSGDSEDEDDDDDEMDWQDAFHQQGDSASTPAAALPVEREIGDIRVVVREDNTYVPEIAASGGKKGPSKRERKARIQTHCLHVQWLMWHNTVRNSWINDKEVQKTLVDGLPDGVKREVTRWRESMGMLTKEELEAKKKAAAARNKKKGGKKGKDTARGRDWSYNASHLEQGMPDLSRGDPILRLLKILTAYWRKRFAVTAPGLRKEGYKTLRQLRDEVVHWEKNKSDTESHGERMETIKDFRKAATAYEGSRDVGAQLFVALLRGLSLETRIVANLQPAGFGWSKAEEADPKPVKQADDDAKDEVDDEAKPKKFAAPKLKGALTPKQSKKPVKAEKPTRTSLRGNKADPISLDDSDSSLSSAPSENEDEADEEDDDDDEMSVVDVTPAVPKKRSTKKYDRSLAFPNYWAEVLSPVSNKFIPVDPIVLSTIASTDDLLQSFEPRGKKAESAKQVICYTVGYAADGTAKDVTVRYLKKHQLPGKTKGTRMPVDKIPIYNRKGKVKRYEEYDWFRTLMSVYDRPEEKRTKADDMEDQTDLKPFKPGQDKKDVEKESLQWYKQSAEFVLEQHLRREEALRPGSEPVKIFVAGKGDKAKEYPVYLREDVAVCKTVESWHKEGRAIMEGEQPMKQVPVRAVTLIRKREMEEVLRDTGEKLKQGLYAEDQTDWIIPPPLENGVIPKNAYGNMDVYVPTMVPKGAVHLPLKGSAKLCKRLQIDFAEACTGFEFGKQRAVPVLTGVVVAKENEAIVRDAWRTEQAEKKRKEDTKRTTLALQWWRKMLFGLRIVQRMERDYADTGAKETNPFVDKALREGRRDTAFGDVQAEEEEEMAGGFFRPGYDEEEVPQNRRRDEDLEGGGFFPEEDEDRQGDAGGGGFLFGEDDEEQGGGFMVDDVDDSTLSKTPAKPISLQMLHNATNNGTEEEEEAEDDEDDEEEEEENVKPPPRRRANPTRKAPVAAKAKRQSLPKRKPIVKSPSASEDEASSSDLSDVSSDLGDINVASERRASSPRVVITPHKAKAPIARGKRSTRKATPVKSPYFSSQANDDDDDDDDDNELEDEEEDEDDQESDYEVVKPRKTTARTRRAA
jgi:xeroderma pigmentosum group C-complementing protein